MKMRMLSKRKVVYLLDFLIALSFCHGQVGIFGFDLVYHPHLFTPYLGLRLHFYYERDEAHCW